MCWCFAAAAAAAADEDDDDDDDDDDGDDDDDDEKSRASSERRRRGLATRDVERVVARIWADLRLPSDLATMPESSLRALLPELDVHEAHELAKLTAPKRTH